MTLPNAREREALQTLRFSEWEVRAKLYPAGPGTVAKMLEKGWIEQLLSLPSGLERFRITPAGISALEAPPPPKPSKSTLKPTAPRLKIAPPRLKTSG